MRGPDKLSFHLGKVHDQSQQKNGKEQNRTYLYWYKTQAEQDA